MELGTGWDGSKLWFFATAKLLVVDGLYNNILSYYTTGLMRLIIICFDKKVNDEVWWINFEIPGHSICMEFASEEHTSLFSSFFKFQSIRIHQLYGLYQLYPSSARYGPSPWWPWISQLDDHSGIQCSHRWWTPLHLPGYHSLLVKRGQNQQHPKSHKNPIVILLSSYCHP